MAYSGKGIQSYLLCVFRGVCVFISLNHKEGAPMKARLVNEQEGQKVFQTLAVGHTDDTICP